MNIELTTKYNNFLSVIEKNAEVVIDGNLLKKPELLSQRGANRARKSLNDDYNVDFDESDDELIAFFIGGTSISWRYSPVGRDFLYGGFVTNSLWNSLVLHSDFWKLDFNMARSTKTPDNLKEYDKINWFEAQSFSSDGRRGCFIREKGVFPPQIAFYDEGWYMPISLSFEEYWQALFDSCAVKGWQYFYVDINKDMPHWQNGFKDMEMAVKYLPTIFPDKDFSYHKQKLEEARIRLAGAR